MLVNFKFKNYRSFKDETTLSLLATKDDSFELFNTFEVDENILPKKNKLIKSVVLYGPNASGKSTILKALKYMKDLIKFSNIQGEKIAINNQPFSFLSNNNETTLFEVEFIKNNIFYNYNFEILNGKIVSENLYKRVERLTKIFSRNDNEIDIIQTDNALMKFIKVSNGALFLSQIMAYGFNKNILDDVVNVLSWFDDLIIVFEEDINMLKIYEDPKYIDEALNILRLADIGISNFKVYKEELTPIIMGNEKKIQLPNYPTQIVREKDDVAKLDIETVFEVYDSNGDVIETKNVYLLKDIGFHSEGTKKLLFYLGWILKSLNEGKVILLDELDTKIHFIVADYILKSFNSVHKNLYNAQIIATAHNLMLMDGDTRRDQIYFTSKDMYGVSTLKSLADFKGVLKKDLFSKKYLLGFYTELPNMNGDF